MRKWWIKRSEDHFEHVSADLLEVNSGALVFKRNAQKNPALVGVYVPVLIVAAGTYDSVHLDEEDELLS